MTRFVHSGLDALKNMGIRSSLFLGFGAMCAVLVLATGLAIAITGKMGSAVDRMLGQHLPGTVSTLQVALAAERLVTATAPLVTLDAEKDRPAAFVRLDQAMADFDVALEAARENGMAAHMLAGPATTLSRHLDELRGLVDSRIDLVQQRSVLRRELVSNLLVFQQQLTYRVRILQGDSDIVTLLLARPTPPVERILEITADNAALIPVVQFYARIEAIHGRLLAAAESPGLAELDVDQQFLREMLVEADQTYLRVPLIIRVALDDSMARLREFIEGGQGILAMRRDELALMATAAGLVDQNRLIAHEIGSITSALTRQSFEQVNVEAAQTRDLQRDSMLILLVGSGLGLFAIGVLMYFHIIRHVLDRLTRLSSAMQDIANGNLDTALPPTGRDELGVLGMAVHRFKQTSVTALAREADLRASRAEITKAHDELEQKAVELNDANIKLTELSQTDALTGLANRRAFDDRLANEWQRALRTGKSLAVVMIDVDEFKKFNDHYGHQLGDDCLVRVAGALQDSIRRPGDMVARYGGEEFVAILLDTDAEGAMGFAEKLRETILALGVEHSASCQGCVSASLGVAVSNVPEIESPAALVNAADRGLYRAKRTGRNRVEFAFPEIKTSQA